jgi:hypothetical protein
LDLDGPLSGGDVRDVIVIGSGPQRGEGSIEITTARPVNSRI